MPVAQAASEISRVQGPDPAPPIVSSGDLTYPFSATGVHYKAEFKGNSRATNSVRFSAGGYSFTMNIATSQVTWFRSDLGAIVGMQQSMNPQDTAALISGNTITYAGAWKNTDLVYNAYGDELKETLVIHAVSPPSNPTNVDYLQYAANCYYTNSLTIYANGVGYLHPTNQRFTTQGEIHFNDASNKTVYWIPAPYMYDSNGTSVMGLYGVNANNGILIINIRFPKAFLDSAVFPVYLDPITRVQGNARGTGAGTTVAVTMGATPTNGNVLVAAIGRYYDGGAVTGISQTGVTWTYQIKERITGNYGDAEIWFGVVGAGASTSVTVSFTGTSINSVVDICEYSGILTSGFLDKTAVATSSSTLTTGTTATTTQNSELWIGCTQGFVAQATPQNGFTLLDGAVTGGCSVGFLEKIVSATGAAASGVTATYGGQGCIATFKAAAGSTDYPRAGAKALTLTKAGTRVVGFVRGDTIAFTLAKAGTKIVGWVRGVTESLTLAKAGTRTLGLIRGTSAAFTLASAGTTLMGWVRGVTEDITFTSAATRLLESLRDAAQTIITKQDATRLLGSIRAATQGLTLTSVGTKMIEWIRDATQSVQFGDMATRLLGSLRGATQGLTFSNAATRVYDAIRAAAQGFTLSNGATIMMGWVRTATQSLTMTSGVTRLLESIRIATQGLTLSNTGTRLFEFIRATSQGLTLTPISDRVIGFIRATTQGLTMNSAVTRLWEAYRDASQSLTLVNSATAILYHIVNFIVAASQGITVAVDAARQINWFRDTSQGFVLTMGGVGYLAIKYIVNVAQSIIIKSFGYGVLNLPVPGSVVTVVEGGLLWGIIIFLIVLIVAAFRR